MDGWSHWRGPIYVRNEWDPPNEQMLTSQMAQRAQTARRLQEMRYIEAEKKARKERKMTEESVHWCEANGWEDGHAFSAKDPDAERIVRQHKEKKMRGYAPGPIYQEEEIVDESYWICGPHKREFGLFQKGKKAAETRAINSPNAEYVSDLEEENKRLDKLIRDLKSGETLIADDT